MFIFETEQNIEQLEQIIIDSEDQRAYSSDSVNEIFRIMHTIKGSAAMMSFNEISSLAIKWRICSTLSGILWWIL
jgi:two-component system chemotaxis sensor kinase CheA